MKIAILNDTHCGIRNSSDIFINNAEKFYADVFFPYLLEHNIQHIVHLGDYYDNRKFINFRALNRNRNIFLKPLREHGITMDIIRGNHDTYYKNTGELNSLKELLGHYMNEVTIIQEPTVMEYGSLKMGLVPWIDDQTIPQGLAGNSAYIITPAGAEQLIKLVKEYGLWPNDAIMCRQLVRRLGVTKKFYTHIQNLRSTTTT